MDKKEFSSKKIIIFLGLTISFLLFFILISIKQGFKYNSLSLIISGIISFLLIVCILICFVYIALYYTNTQKILEQKNRMLQEKETRFGKILDSAAEAIITADENGIIQGFNKTAEKIFQYTKKEVMGKNIEIFMAHPHNDKHTEYIYRYLYQAPEKEINQIRELESKRKDGSKFPIELVLSHIRINNKTLFTAFIRDISERKKVARDLKKAKEEAEAATKMKSNFIANMSHEIRTPMNSILGFLDLTLKDRALPEYLAKNLKIVHKSSKELLILINDILDLSKFEIGRLELENKPFRLRKLINESLRILEIDARSKGLEVIKKIDPDIPKDLIGDSIRLKQILMNLVGNAVKFTEKGRVSLNVKPLPNKENMIHFSVSDTGIGVPKNRLKIIFDAFTQVDNSISRRFGGTGLGITISKQLVELMGGKIWLESEEGKGSTFHFTIQVNPSEKMPPGTKEFKIIPTKNKFHILLVEDTESNLKLSRVFLQKKGHKVSVARNGFEAIQVFKENMFDIILMDILMPDMNGIEATIRIRKIEETQYSYTPIIATTARVMKEDQEKYIKAGMDYVITKPIDFNALFNEIERLVLEYRKVTKNIQSLSKTRKLKLDKVAQHETHCNIMPSPHEMKSLFISILMKCEEHNPDTLEPYLEILKQYISKEETKALYKLINHFDFARVQDKIIELAERIHIDLEEYHGKK